VLDQAWRRRIRRPRGRRFDVSSDCTGADAAVAAASGPRHHERAIDASGGALRGKAIDEAISGAERAPGKDVAHASVP
jgi:hypothetical protein